MSKYKAGDKFVLEIGQKIHNAGSGQYVIRNSDNSITTGKMLSYLERLDMTANEAWELAKKLVYKEHMGGFSDEEMFDIFGYQTVKEIFDYFTPQQAKAKIEAWEKSKEEIKVGDVCRCEINKNVYFAVCVKRKDDQGIFLYDDASCSDRMESLDDWTKTNRHIDIQSVLEQIGGKE